MILSMKQRSGLRLVGASDGVVRDGTTGRVVLPRVWAVAEGVVSQGPGLKPILLSPDFRGLKAPAPSGGAKAIGLEVPDSSGEAEANGLEVPDSSGEAEATTAGAGVAFYRKYTEAMLRRYMRMASGPGRVPSLLGRELFRGHVSSYKVSSFEDVVIFCHDMEALLKRLDTVDLQLMRRIALQEYTQVEAAAMMGMSLRNSFRLYHRALDRLTVMLLEAGMLEMLKSCQGGAVVEISPSH